MRITIALQLLVCLVLGGGCRSTPINPEGTATGFVQALNSKDVAAMERLAATPFRFTNQAWEGASDGSGFVRGKATQRVATNSDELRALFRDVASTVTVEEPGAVPNPPSKADLLKDTLGEAGQWVNLDLVLFKRGEGDVEHVAIVGVDGSSGKVTGFYVN